MNMLIGFEESQEIANACRRNGHKAYSCDLKHCTGWHPEYHLQMDIFKALRLNKWDLIILHPPCTYTCLSGNCWYYNSPLRLQGVKLCKEAWDVANEVCSKVALEQPATIMQTYIGPRTQIIYPYQFGHGENKATWLWLRGLPDLIPTNIVEGRENRIWKMPPASNRSELRSKTYPGIAAAIANQWAGLLPVVQSAE